MPGDTLKRFRFRSELWLRARLMPLQLRGLSFEAVLAHAPVSATPSYKGLPVGYVTKAVKRATRRPWLMRDRRCLRQGLLGFRFLSRTGLRPELHFGIERKSMTAPKLNAHCWVCVNGRPVLNDSMDDMVTIYVHPTGDKRQ